MHPFEEGWRPKLFPLDADFVGCRVKRTPTRGKRMLPINHYWFSISTSVNVVCAVQAEIPQDLQPDLFPCRVGGERTGVIQFAFGYHGRILGGVERKHVVPVGHDQRAERVHHHPRRKKQAAEHMNTADESRHFGQGDFNFWLGKPFGGRRRIHSDCVAGFLFANGVSTPALSSVDGTTGNRMEFGRGFWGWNLPSRRTSL